jgi:uncharacterized protein (TIGR00730 family)
MKKTITVFGSSKPKEEDEEFKIAYELGSLLAGKGFNVCTGGYQGTMNAVSKGAAEKGAEAIGITVNGWKAVPSRYLTKEIKCANLTERLQKLISYGDGYAILQGGTGTLLEFSFIWELMNKKLLTLKPVATHSIMWQEIAEIIDKRLLIEKRVTGLIRNFETVEEIADYLYTNLQG